jgi:hypothetical protein
LTRPDFIRVPLPAASMTAATLFMSVSTPLMVWASYAA